MSEFEFDVEEKQEWELEESFREGIRYVGEKRDRGVHPYSEKRLDEAKRLRRKDTDFTKELTKVRRSVNRTKRRKLARGPYVSEGLTIRPRDYKTYGYETW